MPQSLFYDRCLRSKSVLSNDGIMRETEIEKSHRIRQSLHDQQTCLLLRIRHCSFKLLLQSFQDVRIVQNVESSHSQRIRYCVRSCPNNDLCFLGQAFEISLLWRKVAFEECLENCSWKLALLSDIVFSVMIVNHDFNVFAKLLRCSLANSRVLCKVESGTPFAISGSDLYLEAILP